MRSPSSAPLPPTSAPNADFVGLFGWSDIEGGCALIIGEDGQRWEPIWPPGYRVRGGDGGLVLWDAEGDFIARLGDRVWLNGRTPPYVEGEVILKFDVAVIDAAAAREGAVIPRPAVRGQWAVDNGLEEESTTPLSGSVLYLITDGTDTKQKVDALESLPEVASVSTNALGSFCMVGSLLQISEVVAVEHGQEPPESSPVASAPTPLSALSSVVQQPDRGVSVGGTEATLTNIRLFDLDPRWEARFALDARTLLLVDFAPSVWLADLETGFATVLMAYGEVDDVDPTGQHLLVRGRSTLVLQVIDREGREIGSLRGASPPHGVFLADGTVAVVDGGRLGIWQPTTDSVSWVDLPEWARPLPAAGPPRLAAVGSNVFVLGRRCALIDPRTGAELGQAERCPWYDVVTRPDGSRFVLVPSEPVPGNPSGRLEMRDGATGAVVAVYDGRPNTYLGGVAWVTDDMLLAWRERVPDPPTRQPPPGKLEAYLAESFADEPATFEPLVISQFDIVYRNGLLLANGFSEHIVAEVVEAP